MVQPFGQSDLCPLKGFLSQVGIESVERDVTADHQAVAEPGKVRCVTRRGKLTN